ncbi:hypothetical protein CAOG_03294 [Capsaspora owczarzaki ATCC 30864]|uniref:Membrane-associated protein n=1 Tax=Capsaspora owczarzaki (strain ATCC 30864) TaxID=595528 RepID=A0A0D2WP11_CAPO3|nr:hypothetical protein CAOG_03294 [Capsaspora owczarzaki ATCC 30864]KJE92293.1 hypothetical protein CAOG_003294 [Capsaspora owczarzaki ATCC 30864]|eukprot:XP_004364133.1 hypothetical protein CAOG_03294 [Capsaspora owczarzaki ATCC 30864]
MKPLRALLTALIVAGVMAISMSIRWESMSSDSSLAMEEKPLLPEDHPVERSMHRSTTETVQRLTLLPRSQSFEHASGVSTRTDGGDDGMISTTAAVETANPSYPTPSPTGTRPSATPNTNPELSLGTFVWRNARDRPDPAAFALEAEFSNRVGWCVFQDVTSEQRLRYDHSEYVLSTASHVHMLPMAEIASDSNANSDSPASCESPAAPLQTATAGMLAVVCDKPCDDRNTCVWSTLRWVADGCSPMMPKVAPRPSYTRSLSALQTCIQLRKSILFLGDSTLRGLYLRLLDLVGAELPPPAFHASHAARNEDVLLFYSFWPHLEWSQNLPVPPSDESFEVHLLETLALFESTRQQHSPTLRDSIEGNSPLTIVLFGQWCKSALIERAQEILVARYSKDGLHLPTSVQVIVKSHSPGFDHDWMVESLAQHDTLRAHVQRHRGWKWLDTLTTSLPVWFRFKHDRCRCHSYSQVNTASVASRVIGEVNDVWFELLMQLVCEDEAKR